MKFRNLEMIFQEFKKWNWTMQLCTFYNNKFKKNAKSIVFSLSQNWKGSETILPIPSPLLPFSIFSYSLLFIYKVTSLKIFWILWCHHPGDIIIQSYKVKKLFKSLNDVITLVTLPDEAVFQECTPSKRDSGFHTEKILCLKEFRIWKSSAESEENFQKNFQIPCNRFYKVSYVQNFWNGPNFEAFRFPKNFWKPQTPHWFWSNSYSFGLRFFYYEKISSFFTDNHKPKLVKISKSRDLASSIKIMHLRIFIRLLEAYNFFFQGV